MSLPAINDCAEACPSGKYFFTPCISSASVKVNPWYPIVLRIRPVTFFGEIEVALLAVLSMAGIYKCAIITLPIPALNISRNGYNSNESNCAIVLLITGKSRCESTDTSPCPGKCLAQAMIPASCRPCMYLMPNKATLYLSSPKLRSLITGLLGLLLISTTGA